MFAAQRRRLLLQRLEASGWVSTRDLAEALDVSQVTVRRDLEALQQDGRLQRLRGGARLVGQPPPVVEDPVGPVVPTGLAERAAALVDDGDAVLLGAGRLVAELAALLVVRRGLTVVTNSVLAAEALARAPQGIDVVLTGGSVDGESMALVGGAAEQSLVGLHARRAFLSGAGLTADRGLSDADLPLAAMHRAIGEAAAEVVVLAPASIVGTASLFPTVPPDRVTHLVTDLPGDAPVLEGVRRSGATVHTTS
jgi:DeoR/GlpR family transcriptional regulator of sugar metabolism